MSALEERRRRSFVPTTAIGEALCVVIDRDVGGLLKLKPRGPHTEFHLAGDAEDAVELAQRLARRLAPTVRTPALLHRRLELDAEGVGVDHGLGAQVQGPSLGLAAVLAEVSAICGVPVPVGLVAAARVFGAGRVGHVEGWPAKLAVLERYLPQATLIVSQDDGLAGLAWPRVVSVPDVEAAIRFAFPDAALAGALAGAPATLLTTLLHLALQGWLPDRPWAGFARTAEIVVSQRRGRAPQAGWLIALSDRLGRLDRRAALPAADPLPASRADRDVQALVLANRMEHAHPRPRRVGERLVRDALTLLVDREGATLQDLSGVSFHAAERKLMGAMGRLLITLGRASEAVPHVLEPVRAGWVRAGEAGESSRAVCEILFVKGSSGELDERRARGWLRAALDDPRISTSSEDFLRVALGWALIAGGCMRGDRRALQRGLKVLRHGDRACGLADRPLEVAGLRPSVARAEGRAALRLGLAPPEGLDLTGAWLVGLEEAVLREDTLACAAMLAQPGHRERASRVIAAHGPGVRGPLRRAQVVVGWWRWW